MPYRNVYILLACVMVCSACKPDTPAARPEPESPREVLDEQTRVARRQALIEKAAPPRLEVAPPEPTRGMTQGVSVNAYLIRDSTLPESRSHMTLRDGLENLYTIKKERRDRMKARGEDVSDMNASGQTTLRGALEEMSVVTSCPPRRTIKRRRRKRHASRSGMIIRRKDLE